MKQNITVNQLREIDNGKKEKLALILDNWNEYKIKEGYLSDNDISSQCNIGKMIEILDKDYVLEMTTSEIKVWLRGDIRIIRRYDGCLCDTLWKAVKWVL